ncbi:MAG: hypothetical protein QOG44_2687 [Acidimicrobiaceae bacterium]|nr:hypothetical protein [Acidimicrobiaceae bacterium]
MFERLNPESRQVLEDSQAEARSFHDGFVGPEHLLLALTRQPEIAARFAALGIQREAIEKAVRSEACAQSLDADALAGIGIDLVAVRELVEQSFGTGALEAAAVALERRARRRRRGHMKRLAAAGRDPAGRGPAGRGPAGRDPAGRGPAGRDPAGRDPAGRIPPAPAPEAARSGWPPPAKTPTVAAVAGAGRHPGRCATRRRCGSRQPRRRRSLRRCRRLARPAAPPSVPSTSPRGSSTWTWAAWRHASASWVSTVSRFKERSPSAPGADAPLTLGARAPTPLGRGRGARPG